MTPEEPNVTSEEPNGTSEAFEPERGRAGGDEPPDPVPPAATPDEVLDCLGQRCPLPVIALARRLPRLPVGAVLRVLADDPAAGNDIAAWCRLRGQEHLGSPAPHIHDVRRLH